MIESYNFGQITIRGKKYSTDVKICGNKVICPWRRREGHRVEVRDIQDLLDYNPEIVVLGQGQPGMMQATRDLKERLRSKGVSLVEKPTSEAVQSFNQFWEQGKKVCAGFHLTC